MNKTLKIGLIVVGALVVVGGLLTTGLIAGRFLLGRTSFIPYRMMDGQYGGNPVQRGGWQQGVQPSAPNENANAPYPFENRRGGMNRMSGWQNQSRWSGCGNGVMGWGGAATATAEPLSIESAETAVQKYVDTLNNTDLEISEVMIFDNQAYARVVEKSTGMGAMELLVDNATQSVYPEHGANMMWNLKYSPMAGRGMMGNGMRSFGQGIPSTTTVENVDDMTVSADEAAKFAQVYLDKELPGVKAGEAEPFYGYYTLDTLKDGKVSGMLSVNGFSGQIIVHTWHGTFIEMTEEE